MHRVLDAFNPDADGYIVESEKDERFKGFHILGQTKRNRKPSKKRSPQRRVVPGQSAVFF